MPQGISTHSPPTAPKPPRRPSMSAYKKPSPPQPAKPSSNISEKGIPTVPRSSSLSTESFEESVAETKAQSSSATVLSDSAPLSSVDSQPKVQLMSSEMKTSKPTSNVPETTRVEAVVSEASNSSSEASTIVKPTTSSAASVADNARSVTKTSSTNQHSTTDSITSKNTSIVKSGASSKGRMSTAPHAEMGSNKQMPLASNVPGTTSISATDPVASEASNSSSEEGKNRMGLASFRGGKPLPNKVATESSENAPTPPSTGKGGNSPSSGAATPLTHSHHGIGKLDKKYQKSSTGGTGASSQSRGEKVKDKMPEIDSLHQGHDSKNKLGNNHPKPGANVACANSQTRDTKLAGETSSLNRGHSNKEEPEKKHQQSGARVAGANSQAREEKPGDKADSLDQGDDSKGKTDKIFEEAGTNIAVTNSRAHARKSADKAPEVDFLDQAYGSKGKTDKTIEKSGNIVGTNSVAQTGKSTNKTQANFFDQGPFAQPMNNGKDACQPRMTTKDAKSRLMGRGKHPTGSLNMDNGYGDSNDVGKGDDPFEKTLDELRKSDNKGSSESNDHLTAAGDSLHSATPVSLLELATGLTDQLNEQPKKGPQKPWTYRQALLLESDVDLFTLNSIIESCVNFLQATGIALPDRLVHFVKQPVLSLEKVMSVTSSLGQLNIPTTVRACLNYSEYGSRNLKPEVHKLLAVAVVMKMLARYPQRVITRKKSPKGADKSRLQLLSNLKYQRRTLESKLEEIKREKETNRNNMEELLRNYHEKLGLHMRKNDRPDTTRFLQEYAPQVEPIIVELRKYQRSVPTQSIHQFERSSLDRILTAIDSVHSGKQHVERLKILLEHYRLKYYEKNRKDRRNALVNKYIRTVSQEATKDKSSPQQAMDPFRRRRYHVQQEIAKLRKLNRHRHDVLMDLASLTANPTKASHKFFCDLIQEVSRWFPSARHQLESAGVVHTDGTVRARPFLSGDFSLLRLDGFKQHLGHLQKEWELSQVPWRKRLLTLLKLRNSRRPMVFYTRVWQWWQEQLPSIQSMISNAKIEKSFAAVNRTLQSAMANEQDLLELSSLTPKSPSSNVGSTTSTSKLRGNQFSSKRLNDWLTVSDGKVPVRLFPSMTYLNSSISRNVERSHRRRNSTPAALALQLDHRGHIHHDGRNATPTRRRRRKSWHSDRKFYTALSWQRETMNKDLSSIARASPVSFSSSPSWR